MNLKSVTSGGYCIGCGVCSVVDSSITMEMRRGQYIATDSGDINESSGVFSSVCPFSGEGPNESDIAGQYFEKAANFQKDIGYYEALYAGYVVEGTFRSRGSSGGLISWLASELLRLEVVDYVLHVKPGGETLFSYGISSTQGQIMEGAKSRYYPVEMSSVLSTVKEVSGRYVLIGLPCQVKAVRRLAMVDPVFSTRIVHTIGLVCGHLKSEAFADLMAWQLGVRPGRLENIDFRVEREGRPASEYGVEVSGDGVRGMSPAKALFGTNWGHNLFRYSACNYCDDLYAETADVCVGDAWLSHFASSSKGNSVVAVRSPVLRDILEKGLSQGKLSLDAISEESVLQSQSGGLRDRREGLAYRLHLRYESNQWVPNKRVRACIPSVPARRLMAYQLREELGNVSHEVWEEAVGKGDLDFFLDAVSPKIKEVERLINPLHRRIVVGLKRLLRVIVAPLHR